ncbi:MAG: squalene/phytoene synthase family protein, partial [Acidobacteriota bacterium]|nr:squalene/phytoene synthase family protein [Acidobacteriota bacterium]
EKRARVEAVYAAVRYPDEIVDSFPLDRNARANRLDAWRADYRRALEIDSIRDAVHRKIPCFLVAFAQVVRERQIPRGYYHAFLDAMKMDSHPRPFETLEDLIETYVYGSATVVGYFLAYVYGASSPGAFESALGSARNLGIALQLTNFLRDVEEDRRRGRLYLPLDFLKRAGVSNVEIDDLRPVLRAMSEIAEGYYERAESDLPAFAADSHTAIRACIDVYRQLNRRVGRGTWAVRESVPMRDKFQALPASKYWRIPLAYAGVI